MQGGFNHSSNLLIANPGNPSRAWSIFLQSSCSQCQEALAPELDGWPRYIQLFSNILAIKSVGSHLDDFRTLNNPHGHLSPPI